MSKIYAKAINETASTATVCRDLAEYASRGLNLIESTVWGRPQRRLYNNGITTNAILINGHMPQCTLVLTPCNDFKTSCYKNIM